MRRNSESRLVKFVAAVIIYAILYAVVIGGALSGAVVCSRIGKGLSLSHDFTTELGGYGGAGMALFLVLIFWRRLEKGQTWLPKYCMPMFQKPKDMRAECFYYLADLFAFSLSLLLLLFV